MNLEANRWRRDALQGEVLGDEVIVKRRRRRGVIIALVVAAILAVATIVYFTRGGEPAGAPEKGKGAEALPAVTVVVPGRQQVSRTVSATGTLAARVDMPVGVAGEGGMVVRVLVEPGQWVGAGQALAVVDRSVQSQEAQRLAAQIEVSRADARLAQQELDRAQSLVERGFVSRADVERRLAARDAANARVRVAQAQLNEIRARIGRLDIRSPAAGLVLQRNVEPGQVVSGGSGALFRIARGGEMELRAQLPQQDLAGMRPGFQAEVVPVGSNQSIRGRIWQVSPLINPQSRLGEARIAVPYTSAMRPGGFAEARIMAGAIDAPLLPQSAVQSDDKGNYVYIINGKNEAERRDVQVGEVTDTGIAVIAGLAGNERVVLSAGAFLSPGQKVRPQRAAAAAGL